MFRECLVGAVDHRTHPQLAQVPAPARGGESESGGEGELEVGKGREGRAVDGVIVRNSPNLANCSLANESVASRVARKSPGRSPVVLLLDQ